MTELHTMATLLGGKHEDSRPLLKSSESDDSSSNEQGEVRNCGSDTSDQQRADTGDDVQPEALPGINIVPEDNQPSVFATTQRSTPCFVYTLTFFSAIGGFLFGYDTGVVSGAMIFLREQFSLNSLWQELVVSVTIAAAAIFAFIGGFMNDCLGRKPVILVASLVFTAGAIVLGVTKNRIMLLVGRAIVGMGIGLASMTVPMYIAESAPAEIRGVMVTVNTACITGGQFVASILSGLFSYDRQNGWRYMLGLAGIPSAIQFVGFFFMPESPRWLVAHNRVGRAQEVLQDIRGGKNVEAELQDIRASVAETQAAHNESGGSRFVILRMLSTPHIRRALIVGCGLQMFQQICGINTVMYYSATIIKMSGVKSASMAIWLSSLTAGTNFFFTFLGMFLVERIGRRWLTIGSLLGTTVSLALLAVAFQVMAKQGPPVTLYESGFQDKFNCNISSSCDPCISSPSCGFCYQNTPSGPSNGSCLPVSHDSQGNPVSETSAFGRCHNVSDVDGLEWAYDYCPTSTAWMATAALVLYLAFFATGMGPMPWTINSEIYPLWARSSGNSLATATNWTFNLVISMTFLTLTEVLTKYGAFWLYTGFGVLGCIFLSALLPETKGHTLEQVEELFKRPWC